MTGSDALFVSSTGKAICVRHFQRRLRHWCVVAGLDGRISAHTFRHTLATRLLRLTNNLRLVQSALGHRSITSTIRYAQVPDDQLIAALEAV
jgi:integrase/recombinase XerD